MAPTLTYNTIINVIEPWEFLKHTKEFDQAFGTRLFQCLFEKSPQTKVLFGYPIDLDVKSHELLQSKRFIAHASTVLEMFDMAFNMLGPDIELLMEILDELGSNHIVYGVSRHMFSIMEEALLIVLEEFLGAKFTATVRQSWRETYGFLSYHMMEAYKKKR